MIKHFAKAAAACAGLALCGTAAQAQLAVPADAPLISRGTVQAHSINTKGTGSTIVIANSGGRVLVTLGLSTPQVWAYDGGTQSMTPADPQPAENVNPTGGIGIVVKKNPGSSAMTVPVSGGTGALPPDLADGTYDLIVSIPRGSLLAASALAGTAARVAEPASGAARPVRLVFGLTVAGGRISSTGGTVR